MTVESVLADFHTTASLYALDRRQLGEPRLREAREESYRESPVPESGRPLTEEQRARLDIARDEHDRARRADLVAMSAAELIRTVEKLRGTLDDALRLLDELIDP